MKIKVEIEPIKMGEEEYYTVNQLAAIINKSEQTVYSLIKKGNSVRKMKSVKIGNTVLIPCEELTEFPFTYAGHFSPENIYYYDKNGRINDGK